MTATVTQPTINERSSDDDIDELRSRVDAAANQLIVGLSSLSPKEKVRALLG